MEKCKTPEAEKTIRDRMVYQPIKRIDKSRHSVFTLLYHERCKNGV
jgi:hypothetical protein